MEEEKKEKKGGIKALLENPVIGTVVTFVLGFIFIRGGQALCSPIKKVLSRSGNDAISFSGVYLVFIGIWLMVLLLLVFTGNPMLRGLGKEAKGNRPSFWIPVGIGAGFVLNLLAAGIAILSGAFTVRFTGFNVIAFLYLTAAIFIQAGAEELVCRLYIYQNLRKYFKSYPAVAILGNALFFALMHLSNEGVTFLSVLNIGLMGLFYSLFVYYFDSFWVCALAHCLWNVSQSIFLGLPNSGIPSDYSVFAVENVIGQDSFAYSVKFGLEGAVTCTAIIALAIAVTLFLGKKRNQPPLDVWDVPEEKETKDEDLLKAL